MILIIKKILIILIFKTLFKYQVKQQLLINMNKFKNNN